MSRWAIIFLSVATVAAILGFTNLFQSIALISRIIFFVFLVLTAMKSVVESSVATRKH
ncbi:MAG: DUF1328 domain-containing protein [Chitinophagaceae bacterium]